MKVEEFGIWLKIGNRKKNTIQNRITNCRKVEITEGNLDKFYEKDGGHGILNKLTYSTKDQREKIIPKHKIPIDGDIRTGTSTLKQAVNLYMQFRVSQENLNKELEELDSKIYEIENNKNLSEKEKKVLTKYRIGQSDFRKRLLSYWGNCCSVSGLSKVDLLIVSHIKPYYKCVGREKYDIFNALLLSPNYDKLFDKFYISFNNEGKIIVSNLLSKYDMKILNISKNDFINISKEHKEYLKFHNKKLFELSDKNSL